MMQNGSRFGVKPLEIFRMPMAGPARRDSTPGCRCVAGRPRCRMSALGTVVDGMSLSFLGIGMESLVEGTDLRGADQLRRGRTNVGALGVLLPGPVEPKDAKSQRRREPERTAAVRGGGQREQITVERSKCEFDAMARKEGTKE